MSPQAQLRLRLATAATVSCGYEMVTPHRARRIILLSQMRLFQGLEIERKGRLARNRWSSNPLDLFSRRFRAFGRPSSEAGDGQRERGDNKKMPQRRRRPTRALPKSLLCAAPPPSLVLVFVGAATDPPSRSLPSFHPSLFRDGEKRDLQLSHFTLPSDRSPTPSLSLPLKGCKL